MKNNSIKDKRLSTSQLEAVAQAGFDRIDEYAQMRCLRGCRFAARAVSALCFGLKRLLLLPFFALFVCVCLLADAYLFLLKKVRGSILFPETY